MRFRKDSEGNLIQEARYKTKDDIGKFWVVTDSFLSKSPDLLDALFETDIQGIMLQALGGLKPENIVIITKDKKKAQKVAEDILSKIKK